MRGGTVAATGEKNGVLDTVEARRVYVTNDAGEYGIGMGADDGGNGTVRTFRPNGKEVVALGATVGGQGAVTTYQPNGKELVDLGATANGQGAVTTYQPNGKKLVQLGANDNGGGVVVYNKTSEIIAEMNADDYGNGRVGAWNRKGRGRTLEPGP